MPMQMSHVRLHQDLSLDHLISQKSILQFDRTH
jgi:hypothetical protein